MFIADYHTHSSYSSDSNTLMEDNIKKAIELGLKEIAVTDHIDYDYPDLNYPFVFDYAPYREEIEKLKEKYKGKIIIRTGVEVGVQPHVHELIDELMKNHYDFVIASTHVVDKCDLCVNDFFEGKTKFMAYLGYFADVLNNVKTCDFFNVYGHIDFINRYGDFEDKKMIYSDYKFITDEILKTLIEKGKGIEINTSGFRYGLGHTHPQFEVVKRYKELGGEIITVGSDAHVPHHIAKDFDKAYKMLEEAGFEYITLFEDKKPKFVRYR